MGPLACLLVALAPAPAPEAPAARGSVAVVLDNQAVRVIRPRFGPGQSAPMHEHPERVIVPLTGGRIEQTFPDGRVTTAELEKGGVRFTPPVRHAVRSLGEGVLELLEVEIKPLAGAATVELPDTRAADPVQFEAVLENDSVRVLRLRLGPGERAPSHPEAARVALFLTAARLRLLGRDGPAQDLEAEAASAQWLAAGERSIENTGGAPVEVLLVEPRRVPR